jgi:hypothetical protein
VFCGRRLHGFEFPELASRFFFIATRTSIVVVFVFGFSSFLCGLFFDTCLEFWLSNADDQQA